MAAVGLGTARVLDSDDDETPSWASSLAHVPYAPDRALPKEHHTNPVVQYWRRISIIGREHGGRKTNHAAGLIRLAEIFALYRVVLPLFAEGGLDRAPLDETGCPYRSRPGCPQEGRQKERSGPNTLENADASPRPAGWVTKQHDGTAASTSRAIAESGTASRAPPPHSRRARLKSRPISRAPPKRRSASSCANSRRTWKGFRNNSWAKRHSKATNF